MANHIYGDWKVTKEATETEEGSRERGCAVCEYVQTEAIPAAGTGEPTDSTDPTDSSDSQGQQDPSGDTGIPQTGDSSDMALWISLMLALSLIHIFLKATVIEPLRIRIKHSYHYFMIYQYEYMGCVYQKNTGIDLAYHQAQKKIGTEVEIYIDPSDPEKYFCPADVKMYRMIQICLLCCGWLAIVGTPIACFILEYLY